MMSKKWKVAIVGGGPAGSMTALSICRKRPELAGDILILEGKDFPREKVCGGGVSGKVVDYLQSLGVSLEGVPHVKAMGMYVIFGDKEACVSFAGKDTYVVRRSIFDSRLLSAAMERGVEVSKGTPVCGAYRERNGIVLVDREGKRYEAQVLVGADGVNGESRTWLGIPARKKRSLLLQSDFERNESDHPFDSNLVLDFSAIKHGVPGYVWFFPSVDDKGRPVFNTGITGGNFGGAGSGSLLRKAHEAVASSHPRIRELAPGKFRYRPYPERHYSPFQVNAGPRVLFVGEQIGVDPADGEGLGICADSAAIAATAIVRAFDRGDYSFKDYGLGLLQSDSLALWIASKFIATCLTDRRFDILFPLILNMNGDGREFVMDHYAKIFAGDVKGWTLYSTSLLKELSLGVRQLVSSSSRLL
jgi:flavin-dependent dehydrogenase